MTTQMTKLDLRAHITSRMINLTTVTLDNINLRWSLDSDAEEFVRRGVTADILNELFHRLEAIHANIK